MNKEEANLILSKEIDCLREQGYEDLTKCLNTVETKEIKGNSNSKYQIEIQTFWDDEESRNLRVLVSIDDESWRAFAPLSQDFIIAPNGTFVGE